MKRNKIFQTVFSFTKRGQSDFFLIAVLKCQPSSQEPACLCNCLTNLCYNAHKKCVSTLSAQLCVILASVDAAFTVMIIIIAVHHKDTHTLAFSSNKC